MKTNKEKKREWKAVSSLKAIAKTETDMKEVGALSVVIRRGHHLAPKGTWNAVTRSDYRPVFRSND